MDIVSKTKRTKRRSSIKLLTTEQVKALPQQEWLIDSILPSAGIAGLVGQPAVGKSFFALDMAGCIASGRDWHGRKTNPASVLYVCGEGLFGFPQRIMAWEHANENLNGSSLLFPERPVQLTQPQEFDDLREQIAGYYDPPPGLIVIDTLARSFGDGDENNAKDMGLFISRCDTFVHEFDCSVLVVHHTPKENSKTARGSGAFLGAVETMINLTKKGDYLTVSCAKQKDAAEFGPFRLKMDTIPLSLGSTSCALFDDDWEQYLSTERKPEATLRVDPAEVAYTILLEAGSEGMRHTDWKNAFSASGRKPGSFKHALNKLRGSGRARKSDESRLWHAVVEAANDNP